jgi:hypothetical protein
MSALSDLYPIQYHTVQFIYTEYSSSPVYDSEEIIMSTPSIVVIGNAGSVRC